MNYREKLQSWLDQHQPVRIDSGEVAQILIDLAPIKEATLRRVLRESGWPLAPLVEGVRQESEDNLQRTLTALAEEYRRNPGQARRAVLTARQHAEWNLRRRPTDPIYNENLLWLRTWLENPGVFETWARLRRAADRGNAC